MGKITKHTPALFYSCHDYTCYIIKKNGSSKVATFPKLKHHCTQNVTIHMQQNPLPVLQLIKQYGGDFQQGGCLYKPIGGIQWTPEHLYLCVLQVFIICFLTKTICMLMKYRILQNSGSRKLWGIMQNKLHSLIFYPAKFLIQQSC